MKKSITNKKAVDDMMKNIRILGEDVTISNDTKGINSNDLVAGTAGSGKTRGYVIPNLFYGNDSKIVADTKCNLYKKYGQKLRDMGYRVELVDFVRPDRSTIGYNPFRFISKDAACREYDINKIAQILCPTLVTEREPFWSQSAQMYIAFGIAYVLENHVETRHNLCEVERVMGDFNTQAHEGTMLYLRVKDPNSMAVRTLKKIQANIPADKMHASIMGFVNNALFWVTDQGASRLYNMKKQLSFSEIGREKTALFLNISDTDSARAGLVNLFYAQALQELVRTADENEDSTLEVPVRIILDDFAANVVIPDFDKIISTIRSRRISVSIMLQSIAQLDSMYGVSKAATIIDNCDTQIYLGGQNVQTAQYFGTKMDKQTKSLLSMPIEKECVFIRGQEPRMVDKYLLEAHEEELIGQPC